jgi:glutamine amidotransferase PdxT
MKAIIERINKSNTLSNSKNSLNKPETTKKPIIINNSSILKKIAEMQNKYKSEQIEKMNNLIQKNEFYKQKESTPKKKGIDLQLKKNFKIWKILIKEKMIKNIYIMMY